MPVKIANGDESIFLSIIHPRYVKINIDANKPYEAAAAGPDC